MCWRIARNVTLVNRLAGRDNSSDVDGHRVAGPPFHELFFTKVAVHGLFYHFHASEIHKLDVRLEPAIERHADPPGTRENLRVLDRRFIMDYIKAYRRVSLDHVHGVTMEIARAIKPCRVAKI